MRTPPRRSRRAWVVLVAVAAATSSGHLRVGAQPSPTGLRFAYAENVGWLNFLPSTGAGVTVTNTEVTGFAYGENIGWIKFNPNFGGVANDGTGRLSGFAWGENVGWINFAPAHGGVSIDACGDFNGHAWGENIGWISFTSDGAIPFKVRTPWVSPIDGVPPETSAATSPPLATWNRTDVTVNLSATDCGTGVAAIHHRVDGSPAIVTTGPNAAVTIATEGAHTITYFAVDAAGNAESPKSLTVQIDETRPTVDLRVPAHGAQYFIHQNVVADYTVSDALSGVGILSVTGPDDAPIDTSTAGPHTFSITAVDRAGNARQVSATYTVVYPGNIDPDATGAHFAYGENIGWINLRPGRGPGLTVTDTGVTGFAWSENIGWINLSPSTGHGGVTNDGTGRLAGYAWSENAGWISFSCSNRNSCASVDYRVRIDANGRFSGHAWGENIGWIRFAANGTVPYGVETSWRSPDVTPPTIACPANLTVSTDAGRATAVVPYPSPTATDDGPSVSVLSTPASASTFPLGVTVVTATATDAAGNTAFCTFTVTVRDTEAPVVSCPAGIITSTEPGQASAAVTFTPTAADNVPGVSVTSTPPSGSRFNLGLSNVAVIARDAAGNTASCTFVVRVNDTEAPAITAPPDVIVEATGPAGAIVSDAALGTATATDNAPGVTVTRAGVPAGNQFPLGATPVSYTVTDAAGLSATATQLVTVRDTTPPVITIAAPAAGSYALNQVVAASYSCVDPVSAVATCSGPVANGAALDTSAGDHTFTVTTSDAAGNSSSKTVSYSVSYGVCRLYDATQAKKSGSTVPIKLQLCDAAGGNVSNAAITLTAIDVVKISNDASTEVEDAGQANPDDNFRFDATLGGTGGYIFNLKTTGLVTGTYVVRFRVSGDPAIHGSEALFQVR